MTARSVAAAPRSTSHGADSAGSAAAHRQIRGSSLLLIGRLFSVVVKMGGQVLVVRYLSNADYGVWAYALAAIAFLGGFAHLSLDRSVTRFASIYHQEKQYDRLFGVVLLVLCAVAITGVVFVTCLHVAPQFFADTLNMDRRSLEVLLILIVLVPLEALDTLLVALFATFGRPRAIFVRRYVITPLVQLFVIGLLIGLQGDLRFLAYGYTAGTFVGVSVSIWMLTDIVRTQGLLSQVRRAGIRMPVRELFSFSAPLMTSDWVSVLTFSSGALVLGYYFTPEHVGLLRVVMPLAALNELVAQSFALLFVPVASRLFAQGHIGQVQSLYWRTSLWIAVLTFPLFAITFSVARPITLLLFGSRYESAAPVLAILVLGHFVQAALGFNGSTIKVLGRVRLLVFINLFAALVNVVLVLALVPVFGALGAAGALSGTLIIHNVLKQWGLRAAGGFHVIDPHYRAAAFTILLGCVVLLPLQFLRIENVAGLIAAAVIVSLLVLYRTRRLLGACDVFPEINRYPLLAKILT
jgi:O-antigen/teichoic acid export membrane protein